MRWIILLIICTCVLSCNKNRIDCETDQECEDVLSGIWSKSAIAGIDLKFMEDGTFDRGHWDRTNGWESGNHIVTMYYEVTDFTLYITEVTGSISSKKINRLYGDRLVLDDSKYRRVE